MLNGVIMVYKFGGIKFVQEELTFEELGQVRALVKNSFLNINYLNDSNIVKIVDDMYDKGLLKDVFKIILKPFIPKWKFWIKEPEKIEVPLNKMKTSEIARVIVDFFIYNFGWINNFLTSGNNSTLTNLLSSIPQQKNHTND